MKTESARSAVLVVDDEPQVLAAIEDTLEGDYRVLLHTSPEAAMRLVEKEPDLSVILSDQRMPGMKGDEFLARASAISDASRLMITGFADLEAVIRAVNNGHIFGYISKPWDPAALKLSIFKAAEHHRLLRELAEEKRFFQNLMDNIPDAIFFKDREHRFQRLNRPHAAILGVESLEKVIGRATKDFFPPEEARQREEEDDRVIRSGIPLVDQVRRIVRPGDPVRWSSTTKAPMKDEKGQVTGLVGIARDITKRQEAEHKVRRLSRVHAVLSGINSLIVRVRERTELYREACRIAVEAGQFRLAWIGVVNSEATHLEVVAWDGAGKGFRASTRSQLPLAGDSKEAQGLVPQAVLAGRPMIANDAANDPRVIFKEEHAERGVCAIAAFPLMVSDKAYGVLVLHASECGFFDAEEQRLLAELAGDISFALEHIEKSERLDYLAYYDTLTGLANRTLFLEHVRQACNAAAHTGGKLALMVFDVERFKTINDTLGRQAGDALLRQLAERMKKHAIGIARLARLGADHFAVMVPEVTSEDDLARKIEMRMQQIFGSPYQLGDAELRIGAKLGAAVFPADGADSDALFQNAEAALKKAKRTGERYLFYRQEMTERVGEHLKLENRLRRALEREEFVLHYQPKVELSTRRIVGLEALIRWMTPEGELVPPMKFIPLMEETGLILEVGAWAMRKAVRDHQTLRDLGVPVPRIAVNVSAIQLRKRDFVQTVQAAIEKGAKPPCIDLEITESLIMEDIAANIAKLEAIRALGMQIAIDDFGTGYSSLAYLAKLPVHALKIDRSFIITMLDHPDTMTLVSTVISMANALKLKVVAEGVDSEEQAKILRLMRCDEMQGYLFSKPLPFDATKALLLKR